MTNEYVDNEPGDKFPAYNGRETFTDCAEVRREFELTIQALPNHGFSGRAHEVTSDAHGGYIFRAFAQGSQVIALARLRAAVRAGIAQRFLIKEGDALEMPFERLRGRIDCDGLVVDGKLLDWAAFQALLSTYEGWDFELHIPLEPDR